MNINFIEKTINDIRDIKIKNSYVKLILLWTILESWIVEKSGKEKKREAMNWFRNKDNPVKNCWYEFQTSGDLKGMIDYAKMLGIKISNNGTKYFAKPDNPDDIVELIYSIRNRLVHGEWQLGADGLAEEKSLIELSARFLENWLRCAYTNKVFSK